MLLLLLPGELMFSFINRVGEKMKFLSCEDEWREIVGLPIFSFSHRVFFSLRVTKKNTGKNALREIGRKAVNDGEGPSAYSRTISE